MKQDRGSETGMAPGAVPAVTMNRLPRLAAVFLLLALFAFQAARTATTISATADEPSYLEAGRHLISSFKLDTSTLTLHPPLLCLVVGAVDRIAPSLHSHPRVRARLGLLLAMKLLHAGRPCDALREPGHGGASRLSPLLLWRAENW